MSETKASEIRFYHLMRHRLEVAVMQIVSRCFERGWRVRVLCEDDAQAEAIAGYLWSASDRKFLPCGTKLDGRAQLQPIWLSAADENPNNATVSLILNEARPRSWHGFAMSCLLFDGNHPRCVAAARESWRACKGEDYTLSYWQQDERGSWQQAASTSKQ